MKVDLAAIPLDAESVKLLLEAGAWILHRIAPTTYEKDILNHINLSNTSDHEKALIKGPAIRSGCLYRFRIGKHRWHWALDPNECIKAGCAEKAEESKGE